MIGAQVPALCHARSCRSQACPQHANGDVGPKHMDFNELNLFHLAPDGHTFQFWGIAEDQEEIDAFLDPS